MGNTAGSAICGQDGDSWSRCHLCGVGCCRRGLKKKKFVVEGEDEFDYFGRNSLCGFPR